MSAFRDPVTKLWRVHIMVGGRRFTKRGFATKAAANQEAERMRQAAKTGPIADPFPTFADLVNGFLARSQRTKSTAWTYQLERKLNKAFSGLASLHPTAITRGHVEVALDRLRAQGNGPRSVNEYRKIILAVLNYAVKMQAIPSNPARDIGKVPELVVPVQPIPKTDLHKLILAADPHLKALLTFLSQTGARFVESQRLRWSDVHLEGLRPYCILRTMKNRGGHERTRPQPLTSTAVNAIVAQRGLSTEYVFVGVAGGAMNYETELQRLQRLCDTLKIERTSFHKIRHYVGMLAVGLGKSKKAVANYLGQADTGATERYLHALDSEMWDVARHLEAELAGVLPASADAAGDES